MKLHAKTESDVLVSGHKKTKAEVQKLAKSLHSDWKLGIGAPPHGKRATYGYVINIDMYSQLYLVPGRIYTYTWCIPGVYVVTFFFSSKEHLHSLIISLRARYRLVWRASIW